ncbi:MAG: hypothetical protein HYU28_10970, partial [Actinobacteria bacterium]|nr:hypothetical protein [Actinomycetota bacterium]
MANESGMMRRAFVGLLAAVVALPLVIVTDAAREAGAVPSSELVEAAEQLAFGAPRFMRDLYGGVYGDQNRITLAVTDVNDARVAWVQDQFPYAGQLDVVSVDHTLDELAVLTDRIDADSARLLALGIDLAAWGPDLDSNTVEVQVEGLEFWQAAELVGRYGVGWVTVVEGQRGTLARCDSRQYCPTLRAGLELELSEPEGACTSGFQARLAGTDTSIMLSAGHCAPSAGTALHRVQPVGPIFRNAFEPVPSAATSDTAPQVPVWRTKVDAVAVLQLEAAGQQVDRLGFAVPWLHSASIYVNDLNKERPVGRVFSGGYAPGATQVCSVGAVTAEDCGAVTSAGW